MNVATLGVKIDPTGATSGGAEVLKVLKNIETQAARTATGVEGLGKKAESGGKQTTSALSKTRGGFDNLMAAIQTGGGAASGSFGSMLAGATRLGIGLGLVATAAALAFGAIKKGDELTGTLGRLAAATGDVKSAMGAYEGLYKISMQTGVAVADSANAFGKFALAGRQIGATGDQVLRLTGLVQKAGIVSGSTTEEIKSGTLQIGQALSSGVLQGDELRSVLENMPILAESLAKQLGVGIGELRKMGSEGELTSKKVFDALLKGAADIEKKFDGMPMTMSRAWDILGVATTRLLGEMDRAAGASQTFAGWIKEAANWIDQFSLKMSGAMANGNMVEVWALKFRIAVADVTDFLAVHLAQAGLSAMQPVYLLGKSQFWEGMGKFLLAAAANFGSKMMEFAEKFADFITAALTVAANMALNKIDTIKSAGGMAGMPGNRTESFDVQYNNLRKERTLPGGSQFERDKHINNLGNEGQDLMDAAARQQAAETKAQKDALDAQYSSLNGQDNMLFNTQQTREEAALLDEANTKKGEGLRLEHQSTMEKQMGTQALTAQNAELDKFIKNTETDAKLMHTFNMEMQAIQASGATGLELARRREMLLDSTAKNVADPSKYAAELGAWRTAQEEKVRIAQEADRKIEAGQATMTESFMRGMDRTVTAWGNASQQMSKLGSGIASTISGGISNALTEIVTGTKSAKDAFRDMAISILNDIAKMIIQMLVELAVRQAIQAISGGFAGGGAVGGGDTSGHSTGGGLTAGYASGGTIRGGRGGIDDIPAMLTAGEFVLKKTAVEKYGTHFLDDLNNGRVRKYATGGQVGPSNRAFQRPSDNYNVQVSLDMSSKKSGSDENLTPAEERERNLKKAKQLEAVIKAAIQEETRQGGILARR